MCHKKISKNLFFKGSVLRKPGFSSQTLQKKINPISFIKLTMNFYRKFAPETVSTQIKIFQLWQKRIEDLDPRRAVASYSLTSELNFM